MNKTLTSSGVADYAASRNDNEKHEVFNSEL